MKLKIITDNELEELHGKILYSTFEEIPLKDRPALIKNEYFNLGFPDKRHIIIQIDRTIVKDGKNVYLHQLAKDLFYGDLEFIEF